MLAMVDYVSRVNDVMLCSDYDDLREYRLSGDALSCKHHSRFHLATKR